MFYHYKIQVVTAFFLFSDQSVNHNKHINITLIFKLLCNLKIEQVISNIFIELII